MPRERIATKDAVFEAADSLANAGERVTVTAVRDTIGGGSNSSIQELLVDWRRDRRTPVARHSGSLGDSSHGSAKGHGYPAINGHGHNGHTNGIASAAGLSRNTPVAIPDPMRSLLDTFSNRLSLIWADAVANTSTNDQLAVIRAAAEARVREADDQARALEEDLVDLQNEIVTIRAERDGLAAALETANDRAAEAQNDAARAQYQLAEIQEMATVKIAQLKNERDAAEREILALQQEVEALRSAHRAVDGDRDLSPVETSPTEWRDDQPFIPAFSQETQQQAIAAVPVSGDPIPPPLPADRRALMEAVRSAEKTRDLLRVERDRLVADVEVLRQEKTQLIADMARLEQEMAAMKARMEKQAAWIAEARTRMTKAGLLKPKRPLA